MKLVSKYLFPILFLCPFFLYSEPQLPTITPFNEKFPFNETQPLPMQEKFNSEMPTQQSSVFTPEPMPRKEKSTVLTIGLATLFPGLGHVYLGQNKEAGELAGSYMAGLGMSMYAYGKRGYTFNNIWQGGNALTSTSHSYGIYAAYRDLRAYRGEEHYTYQMPTDSFGDLSYASFQPSVLKKPEVWGGLLGSLAVATTIGYFAFQKDMHITCSAASRKNPIFAFPVGISEESLFRGYLQSAISESSNPTTGIVCSSLLFGAAHIPNATFLPERERWRYYAFSLPYITAVGAYFGWMTYKNHSLKESVAMHAWYDFILFLASSLTASSIRQEAPTFQATFTF